MSKLIVPPIKTSRFILFEKVKIKRSQSLSEFLDVLRVYREYSYIGVAERKVLHFPKGSIESKYHLCGKGHRTILTSLNPVYGQNKTDDFEGDEVRYSYITPAAIVSEDKAILFPALCITTRVDLTNNKTQTSIIPRAAEFADISIHQVCFDATEDNFWKTKPYATEKE